MITSVTTDSQSKSNLFILLLQPAFASLHSRYDERAQGSIDLKVALVFSGMQPGNQVLSSWAYLLAIGRKYVPFLNVSLVVLEDKKGCLVF